MPSALEYLPSGTHKKLIDNQVRCQAQFGSSASLKLNVSPIEKNIYKLIPKGGGGKENAFETVKTSCFIRVLELHSPVAQSVPGPNLASWLLELTKS